MTTLSMRFLQLFISGTLFLWASPSRADPLISSISASVLFGSDTSVDLSFSGNMSTVTLGYVADQSIDLGTFSITRPSQGADVYNHGSLTVLLTGISQSPLVYNAVLSGVVNTQQGHIGM